MLSKSSISDVNLDNSQIPQSIFIIISRKIAVMFGEIIAGMTGKKAIEGNRRQLKRSQ